MSWASLETDPQSPASLVTPAPLPVRNVRTGHRFPCSTSLGNSLTFFTRWGASSPGVSAVSLVVTSLEATDPSLLSLREHWREQSLAVAWLRSGDWFHPAVDSVVEAVTSDDGVLDALEALGVARASHGVGMGETIDDLACLYRVLEGGAPPLDAVRALCEGWASPAG